MSDLDTGISCGRLTARLGDQVVASVLLDKPVVTIGRLPGNDLLLSSQQVSGRHAEVHCDAEGPHLIDLGSSNGTMVGSTPLIAHKPRLLSDGETFQIGPYTILYGSLGVRLAPAASSRKDAGDPANKSRSQPAASGPSSPRPPRQAGPMPQPVSTTSLYMQYLPEALQEGDFLNRFLLILEGIWEPLEQRQDHIEMYFDPQTCSASMLPWFAGWLDTEINPGWPEMLIRDVLSEAMQLHNWRGTIYGLTRTLELTTGMSPRITQSEEPYSFEIRFPFKASGVERTEIQRLIEENKPAHAGYVLEFD